MGRYDLYGFVLLVVACYCLLLVWIRQDWYGSVKLVWIRQVGMDPSRWSGSVKLVWIRQDGMDPSRWYGSVKIVMDTSRLLWIVIEY